MTTEKLVERFEAQDDAGNTYTVHVFQEFRNAGTLDNPHATVAGMKRATLSNGQRLSPINETTYKIFINDITITKI